MKPSLISVTLLVLALLSLDACAMGKSSVTRERKHQDKLWRPCQDFEDGNPIGKFCNRTCESRKRGACKKWKTTIRDFSKKEDFLFFRNNSSIMIDEDMFL